MSFDFPSIARSFAASGIRHAFGVTGSGASLRLIEALQASGVTYFPAIHEAAAGLMAGGACLAGETRAMAVTIKGPGFANLVPALLSNRYEGRPAISVSEAYGEDANAWQAHKRLDHPALCRQLTKACIRLDAEGASIGALSRIARAEIPGPCHIDLSASPAESIGTLDEPAPTQGRGSLGAVLSAIRGCQRPLVLLGSWAARLAPAVDWDRLSVPVVTTAAAKGAIDETGAYAAGVVTGESGALSPEANILPRADLVIAFGLRNREMVRAAPYHCPLIVIDAFPMESPGGFKPVHELATSSAEDLAEVVAALDGFHWGESEIVAWRKRIEERVLADDWQAGTAFRLVEGTLRNRGFDPRVVLDTGFFCTVGETMWRCRRPGDYAGSAVGRYMGVSIPSALGLAISDRARPVVCAAGDGGIGAFIGELRLAVSENLPLLVLCFSDGGYGSVAAFSPAERAIRRATEFPDPSWWKVAAGLGIRAANVDTAGDLAKQLEGWNPPEGPLFLQLMFDPVAYREIARQLR